MLKLQAIGNVGSLRPVEGKDILNISIAVNERYTNAAGDRVETTEWLNCTAFGKTATILEQYVSVGHKLYIEAKPRTRKYTDKDGIEKYSTEYIINNFEFLTKRDAQGGAS